MTVPYDDALRERIQTHLAGHDRRAVTDATKRHAAVAVVLVDSEVGEDRVDPAPVDDWNDGRELALAGLDGRMVDVSGRSVLLVPQGISPLIACCTVGAARWAPRPGRNRSRRGAARVA